MIGRISVPADHVPVRENIRFLGPRPYETLPLYGRMFDVAIIPYKLTDQVIAANPLKLREYLAMGLPIVSVSTPEIDRFAPVVSIAPTADEFIGAVRKALDTPKREADAHRRMQFVAEASWEARVAGLLPHIDRILGDKRRRRVA